MSSLLGVILQKGCYKDMLRMFKRGQKMTDFLCPKYLFIRSHSLINV